jgi:hypothetical protein
METPAMPIQPSDTVSARGALWHVTGIEEGEDCRALRLVRIEPEPAGVHRTLLEPFDRVEVVRSPPRTVVLSARR